MKIGYAYPEYGRSRGIARYATEIAERIVQSGHEVHFHFISELENPASPDLQIRFHQVPVVRSPHSLELASFAVMAEKALRTGSYDLVHTHGSVAWGDIVTAHSCHRAAMIMREKVMGGAGAVSHGERTFTGDRATVGRRTGGRRRALGGRSAPGARAEERNFGLADRVRLSIERRLYGLHHYGHVIAVSEGVKRELEEFYRVPASDCTVIPNGVDVGEFHPRRRATDGVSVRRRHGIPSDARVLILAANEFERKGLPIILEALTLLEPLRPWLMVVGEGDPAAYPGSSAGLSRPAGRTQGRVIFTGRVEDIAPYYAAADIFVMPTFYEAFSLATLEAAASGLPLVITRVNGTEELVREGETGLFIERNPESLAEALRGLLQDPLKIQQIGARAHGAAQAFAWPLIVERILRLYKEYGGRNR